MRSTVELPLPPIELRHLVGPQDSDAFDNPSGAAVFQEVPTEAYASVLDFGCGCGRLARRLIQQAPRPGRYVGLDPHRGMVDWCQTHLAPHAPGFEFRHLDVFQEFMNPRGSLDAVPLPVADRATTLFIAWSVFTHLVPPDAEFYLGELARVLAPDGLAVTTWFLFDKADFPMMQRSQNALYISDFDPTNAVIFDRSWLSAALTGAGLGVARLIAPAIRGYQWTIHLRGARGGDTLAEMLSRLEGVQPR